MRTKTFKTYSYHRDVSSQIVVTRHFRTLGALCARSAKRNRTRMKTDVEKKNNGRVKNRKGMQKEEGGKTFVYDKRNRAITCAFSRNLHLTLCS